MNKESHKVKENKNSNQIEAIREIILGEREKQLTKKMNHLESLFNNFQNDLRKKCEELNQQLNKESKLLLKNIESIQLKIRDQDKIVEGHFKQMNAEMEKKLRELTEKKLDRDLLLNKLNDLINAIQNS
jgi:hypothetical protein